MWDRSVLLFPNRRRNIMSTKNVPYKIYLEEDEMPKAWYNVRADMVNKPAPLLNPQTMKPATLEEVVEDTNKTANEIDSKNTIDKLMADMSVEEDFVRSLDAELNKAAAKPAPRKKSGSGQKKSGESKLAQGREAVKQLLTDNVELCEEIEAKIREALLTAED
jgi:hypothetical protein